MTTARSGRAARTNDSLMTPGEVAAVFRVDPKTVTKWANAGKLHPIITPGGTRRYRRAEVELYLVQPGGDR